MQQPMIDVFHEQVTQTAELSARELATLRTGVILDVRTREEREGELGYIPGSRWCPVERLAETLPSIETPIVVLVCLSGKRSHAAVEALQASSPQPLCHLSGGMLAWCEAGLPRCGNTSVPATELVALESVRDFPRAVLACFVAESVEAQLAVADDAVVNPRQEVERVFGASDTWDSVDGLVASLDRLAERARTLGHPLTHIAMNVDRMRASLRAVC